jgi:hypothetical protein
MSHWAQAWKPHVWRRAQLRFPLRTPPTFDFSADRVSAEPRTQESMSPALTRGKMVMRSPQRSRPSAGAFPLTVIRLVGPALMCVAIAIPASADVTLRSTRTETVDGGRIIEVTEYRKGLRMRTDLSGGGITRMSMIVDAATGRVVMLFPDGKTAEVSDWMQEPALPRRGGIPEYKQSITPTGRSRQIAGSTCTVYDVRSSARYPEMERDGAVN